MDTIYAVSTAPGRAGISIIRLSGSRAFEAVEALAGDLPAPRTAALRYLRDQNDAKLDQALVICFEHGHSFTGERMAELHCHGSPAVVQVVLECLSKQDGLKPAEPGEFTRRALENGKLDISQVEGLSDLLEAETESQRAQALRVLDGELAEKVEGWRQGLIRSIALVEATIDFADEEVPEDVSPEVREIVDSIRQQLASDIDGFEVAERIRMGFEVAIVGAPNVGKSTLLNVLAGREAAITSSVAGTTRDVIEVRMDLRGLPVTILDTAGLRDTDDEVETLGIERARARAEAADLRVFLILPGQQPELTPQAGDIVLTAQSDITGASKDGISGLTGEGVSNLIERIVQFFEQRVAHAGLAVRERHRLAMQEAATSLEMIQQALSTDASDTELIAEELRRAIRALDSIVGRFDIEAVLDEIFLSFCLGK